MKRLARFFFNGLIILIPIVASIYVIYATFTKIDGLLGLPVPGAGFIVTIAFITIIGFLGSNFLTKKLFYYIEELFTNLPLIKLLYTSIKDLIGAFVGNKKSFNKPVLVTLDPENNINVLGFITRESLEFLEISDHAAVYLPQSYNFAGNLVIVPKERIKPVNVDSTEAMSFIVSGGISGGNGLKK